MSNLQRIFSLSKALSNSTVLIRVILSGTSTHILCHNIDRHYISTNVLKTIPPKESLITKIFSKIPFLNIAKRKLRFRGYIAFESIVDQMDYPQIFKTLNLPDTFYSWFVVTELYIWMLMVRYMAEGDDGRKVRNSIVEALWTDCSLRAKELGAANPSGVRLQISELSDQLHAAIIAYDEGLQSDDTVLAGALWRRLYQYQPVDPEHLDVLVKYVRRQVKLLDALTIRELFHEKNIKWEPIVTIN